VAEDHGRHYLECGGGISEDVGDGNLPMGQIARRPWGERSF